jgi:hypothetical protein
MTPFILGVGVGVLFAAPVTLALVYFWSQE